MIERKEMSKMVNIKLKSLDEIIEISQVYPVMGQGNMECYLYHRNSLNVRGGFTSALFPAILGQFCGKIISVVDKSDYEYANDYCLYHDDYKFAISDWMIDTSYNDTEKQKERE